MSIGSLLNLSRDALTGHQSAIGVTGHNIANVNTPGYTRQRAILSATTATQDGPTGQSGGVAVERVVRIYDRYIESQIIEQTKRGGYGDTMLRYLRQLEVALDETQGEGIDGRLNRFWSSWEELARNPGGGVERRSLLAAAEDLAGAIARNREGLDTLQQELNLEIGDAVTEINRRVAEIGDLNGRIVEAASRGGGGNDLLDRRAEALRELAALIDVRVLENRDGSVDVHLASGHLLLQGTSGEGLTSRVDGSGRSRVGLSSEPGESLNGIWTNAKLGALVELQATVVPEYAASLDDFAKGFADRINELHQGGFDAFGRAGLAFFELSDPDRAAGTIRVNPAIAADVQRIAASSTVTGDGDHALRIASIQQERLLDGRTTTPGGYLAAISGRIGQRLLAAQGDSDRQALIRSQLDAQRESISGISIDEEMIRLIQYQMGYNAAGKLCSVVDEMLDTLMGLAR